VTARRWFLLEAVALGLLAHVAVVLFLWLKPPPPPPGVTMENLHRLRIGMLLQDVKDILGEPAESRNKDSFLLLGWKSPATVIWVLFDHHNTLQQATGGDPRDPFMWDQLPKPSLTRW